MSLENLRERRGRKGEGCGETEGFSGVSDGIDQLEEYVRLLGGDPDDPGDEVRN